MPFAFLAFFNVEPVEEAVGDFKNDTGKVFASIYALFSGLAFITIAGIIVTPVAHRLLHWFHVEEGKEGKRQKAKGKS